MHYFVVEYMTAKKEAACHGMNSNLKLIPSGEQVLANFQPFKAKNEHFFFIFPKNPLKIL